MPSTLAPAVRLSAAARRRRSSSPVAAAPARVAAGVRRRRPDRPRRPRGRAARCAGTRRGRPSTRTACAPASTRPGASFSPGHAGVDVARPRRQPLRPAAGRRRPGVRRHRERHRLRPGRRHRVPCCGRPTSARRSTRPPCPGSAATSSPTVGITSTPVIDTGPRASSSWWPTEQAGTEAAHHLIGLDLYTGAGAARRGDRPAVGAVAGLRAPAGVAGPDRRPGDHRLRRQLGRLRPLPRPGGLGPRGRVGPVRLRRGRTGPATARARCGWAARPPSVDAQGDVWVATGNSADQRQRPPATTATACSKLSPTAAAARRRSPRPPGTSDNDTDADLGSTAPALLPNGLVFEVGQARAPPTCSTSPASGGIGGQLPRRPRASAATTPTAGRPT